MLAIKYPLNRFTNVYTKHGASPLTVNRDTFLVDFGDDILELMLKLRASHLCQGAGKSVVLNRNGGGGAP